MKKLLNISCWISAACCLAFIISCEDEINPQTDLDQIIFPDSNISFKNHVTPFLTKGCAIVNCHDGTSTGVMPNLTSYYGVRHQTLNLVVPGKPELSGLVLALEGNHNAAPLPNKLTQNHVNGIKQWIREGALDN